MFSITNNRAPNLLTSAEIAGAVGSAWGIPQNLKGPFAEITLPKLPGNSVLVECSSLAKVGSVHRELSEKLRTQSQQLLRLSACSWFGGTLLGVGTCQYSIGGGASIVALGLGAGYLLVVAARRRLELGLKITCYVTSLCERDAIKR